MRTLLFCLAAVLIPILCAAQESHPLRSRHDYFYHQRLHDPHIEELVKTATTSEETLLFHYTTREGFEQAIYHQNILGPVLNQARSNGQYGGYGLYAALDPWSWKQFKNRPFLLVITLKPGSRYLDFHDEKTRKAFSGLDPNLFEELAKKHHIDAIIENQWGDSKLQAIIKNRDCVVVKPAERGFWELYNSVFKVGRDVPLYQVEKILTEYERYGSFLQYHDPNGYAYARSQLLQKLESLKQVDCALLPNSLSTFGRVLYPEEQEFRRFKKRVIERHFQHLEKNMSAFKPRDVSKDLLDMARGSGADLDSFVKTYVSWLQHDERAFLDFHSKLSDLENRFTPEMNRLAKSHGDTDASSFIRRILAKHPNAGAFDFDSLKLAKQIVDGNGALSDKWPWDPGLDRYLFELMLSPHIEKAGPIRLRVPMLYYYKGMPVNGLNQDIRLRFVAFLKTLKTGSSSQTEWERKLAFVLSRTEFVAKGKHGMEYISPEMKQAVDSLLLDGAIFESEAELVGFADRVERLRSPHCLTSFLMKEL